MLDLDGVTLVLTGRSISYPIDISPDGQHVALVRSRVVDGRTVSWCEVDGRRGPEMSGTPSGTWSRDGGTYAYLFNDARSAAVGGATFGPYRRLSGIVMSPSGAHWASFDAAGPMPQDSTAVVPRTLIVDGRPAPFPSQSRFVEGVSRLQFVPPGETLAFSAWDAQARAPVWYSAVGGGPMPAPTLPPPATRPIGVPATVTVQSAGTAVKSNVVGYTTLGLKYVRHQLIVNGAPIGTYDAVYGTREAGQFKPGTIQPDGTTIVYAAADDKLYRLSLPPIAALPPPPPR